MGPMSRTLLVVPCYNEAKRIEVAEWLRLANTPAMQLLFVDDGSTDGTAEVLGELAERAPANITILALVNNCGKAEAVRQGILAGLQTDAEIVAFVDADLATPVDEIIRISKIAAESEVDVVIGSRIAHMGANIDRSTGRHLLGRVFATAASLALRTPIYDTQCGAKFFRANHILQVVMAEPFHSRWAFDVELIGRLLGEGASVIEVPLLRWVDVPGSKIGFKSMLKAGVDLVQIRAQLAKRNRQG